jgi:site-specific recombinase XerD
MKTTLEEGVPIHVVKDWIGHCDFTTLNRYKAAIEVKQPKYRNYVNRVAEKVKV